MDQTHIFRPKRLQWDGKLNDIHPSQNGACKADLFSDETGNRYVGKSNIPSHGFVVTNEYISSQLLKLIGIPTPDHLLYRKNGDLFFLSRYGDSAKKLLNYQPGLLSTFVTNLPDLIGIFCFDVWVMNYDRHRNNIIVHNGQLTAIDHDRAIFNQCTDEKRLLLRNSIDPINFLHREYQPYLSEIVSSFRDVQIFIDRIKAITDDQIREAINNSELNLEQKYSDLLFNILVERRNNIEEILKRVFRRSTLFPKMIIHIS